MVSENDAEIAKAVGKVADLLNEVGGFLYKIAGQAIEDTSGILIGDPLREYRIKNLIDRTENVRKKMLKNKIENLENVSPKVLIEWMDKASLEDDELLKEMWENLLVEANKEKSGKARVYLSILSQMNPDDALLFQFIKANAKQEYELWGARVDPIKFPSERKSLIIGKYPKMLE